jgi:Cu2+-containing amine oxidase
MTHPLDPLTAAEITHAVATFRSQHDDEKAFFSSAGLV